MKSVLAVTFGAITVLILLGGVWYWALAGMSHDVGTAWGVTGLVFALATFLCAIWASS